MSYCKGQVYLYQAGGYKQQQSYFVCHECKLSDKRLSPVFDTRLEAIDHLREHLKKGHRVPARAFTRLWYELERSNERLVGR